MIIKKSINSIESGSSVFASNYRYPERSLEPPESKWKDVNIENQTVNYTLDAVIEVYSDGSWDYESVNSNETDWYSDVYDVFLCDDSDVLDYIHDLIGDNLNVPEGRYHVEGDVTLVFSVDGVRVQREYFEDELHGVDYDESVSSDNAEVDFLSHLSHIDNLTLTKRNNSKNISSSSDVKASNNDYNPYSFMVGDQLEWSGLYGGQYKGVVTNVNDEYVTVEVMWTAEDSGDTIIDTQQFELATDPEGKECIIVWTYGSDAGYVYPPSNDYINSAYEYDIYGSDELGSDFNEYEDDIQEISQEFTSENTSINSTKLPAIFKMVSFEPGTTNIDYGGGRFDNVADYLTQYDVINLVYDPYNRTPEHNKEVIKTLRRAGGADTATCSNVLNVIKEPEVRKNVLKNISKIVKPGGKVYITVYEGSGKGDEGPTKAGYQLNRRTADYLDEIREVFPDANRRGKLIVATNSRTVNSSTNKQPNSKLNQIRDKITKVVKNVMMFEAGFSEDEVEEYSVVEVDPSGKVEVRAEVDYDGLMSLCDALNPIVQRYDKDSYFEPVQPGIIQAWVNTQNDVIESSITSSSRYWYFTRHGVQPGSVPKYVNILDIVDTPEGTYFLADGVILTNDLRNYEITERKPEGC